jgi:hypothetical protein
MTIVDDAPRRDKDPLIAEFMEFLSRNNVSIDNFKDWQGRKGYGGDLVASLTHYCRNDGSLVAKLQAVMTESNCSADIKRLFVSDMVFTTRGRTKTVTDKTLMEKKSYLTRLMLDGVIDPASGDVLDSNATKRDSLGCNPAIKGYHSYNEQLAEGSDEKEVWGDYLWQCENWHTFSADERRQYMS